MSDAPSTGFTLSNRFYDRAKFAVQIVSPAFGVLYTTLAALYHWDNVDQVVGTLTAVTLFVGIVLGISSKNFQTDGEPGEVVGDFSVTTQEDGLRAVKLNLDRDPEDFVDGTSITFKVSRTENLP